MLFNKYTAIVLLSRISNEILSILTGKEVSKIWQLKVGCLKKIAYPAPLATLYTKLIEVPEY